MAAVTVHAGDFPKGKGTVMFGMIAFPPGDGFIGQRISVTELETVEIATEESVKKVAGTVGWGAAGAIILGPVGLLAGLLLGGRKTEVTFVARFKDGRKFLGTAESKAYKAMLTGAFNKVAAPAVQEPTPPSAQTDTPSPEMRREMKQKDIYEMLEVSRSASKEMIDMAYGVLSKGLSALAETGDAEAQGKLAVIKSAYEILSNPRQKALYDERLEKLQPRSIARPIVAADTKAPSDCPKCGSKNWKPASAVYKLFLRPEPKRQDSDAGEPADDTPKGQFVSAAERAQLYKAAAPPNSFNRTGVLLTSAIIFAPIGWFFGLQWFLLIAMLGIATIVAYNQESKRNAKEMDRWKALVMCMECGHVFTPTATDLLGVQRDKRLAKMRDAEKEVSARQWKTFTFVTAGMFAILVASSIVLRYYSTQREIRRVQETTLTAESSDVASSQELHPALPTGMSPLTIQGFEDTAFYRQYPPKSKSSWKLRTGGMNFSYSWNDSDNPGQSVGVELNSMASDIRHVGVMWYGDSTLQPATLTQRRAEFLRGLVKATFPELNADDVVAFTEKEQAKQYDGGGDTMPHEALGSGAVSAGVTGSSLIVGVYR